MRESYNGLKMPHRLYAMVAILLAVSLGVLDGVIVNIALPTISAELGVSSSESIWIINSYQIAVIVTILLFAALGDIIGYRKIYLCGLLLFLLSSVACAFSWDFHSLVLFRIIQGIGASGIMSVNTSLVRLIFPSEKLGLALGINSTVVSVSAVIAPSLSAAILSLAPWYALFLFNIPLGCVAILLALKFLPRNPSLHHGKQLQWSEIGLNVVSFGLLFAAVTGISHGVQWWIIALELLALLVVGRIYIRSQLSSASPILPLSLLRIPIFSVSIVTSILSFVAQMSAIVALPFYLVGELGYSAVEIALVMTAWPAVNILSAPVAGALISRLHAGWLGSVGLLLFTTGLLLVGSLPASPEPLDFIWRLAICGLGFGFFQSPNNSIIISSAPLSSSGSASGMMASARLVGQILGAAAVALLLKVTDGGLQIILFSGALALVATLISLSRLHLPLPELISRR